jgi:hypothetical protein
VYILIEDDPQPGNFSSEISKYPKCVGVISSSSSPFELGIPYTNNDDHRANPESYINST